ncbi:hypothetical protein DVA67_009120 [Solirubrobacter sp. CPCC 204708]|uniref:Uncharacterized protein n=1 Tax=Solirubrobacter deserti TaxID=2282478 RepID=A0ABT4REZ4_9ACTN|nr:hypothetical protein [Solirubrobacter deserti]MBE2316136.1 hypothetical protein [Solirubrobacter deserti]MDA0136885.1 hypothetical protein [Solirubrobacter deserti]
MIDADARLAALRGPLLAELQETARPRRRKLALPALVAILTALIVWPSSASLAVERRDGWIELRIEDATASPETLTRELRDAGINGEVRVLAVPPHLVGKWVSFNQREPSSEGRVRFAPDTVRVQAIAVEDNTFVFMAGRAARPGEPYDWDGRKFREGVFK